ncbi:predicted protein [Naegleria gruberi]|uniref:Predicted protein n=1 Tax=Naegleria gruberi TaxID=5762 RepID=D2VYN7_NAEGR|nr:uncharacterized protein NAEGRDRAFT_74185 [Naegleria gruberi]EFC38089.1 predicted protein [Naegleria gruberi]|eukprot:XP_002670833.1 predicted protein [Naegleria gruberi strain NEG-M]
MQISSSSEQCLTLLAVLFLPLFVYCSDFGKIYTVSKYNSKQVYENIYESSTYNYQGFQSPSDYYKLPTGIQVSFRYQFQNIDDEISSSDSFSFQFHRETKLKYSIDFPLIQNVTILNATVLLNARFGIFNVDIPNQLIARIGDLHFTKLNQTLKEKSEFGEEISSIDEFSLNLNLSQIFTTINSTTVALIYNLGDTEPRNVKFSQWTKLSCPSSYELIEEKLRNSKEFTSLGFVEGPVSYNDPSIPKFKIEEMNQVRVEDIQDSYNKRPGFEYTILKSYMFYQSNIEYDNLLSSYINFNFESNGNFTDIYGRNVIIDLASMSCGARVKYGYKFGDEIKDYSFEDKRSNEYVQCDHGTFFNNSLIVFYGKVLNGPLPPVPYPSFSPSPSPHPHYSKQIVSSSSSKNGNNQSVIIGVSVGLGLFAFCVVISIISMVICIVVKRRQKYAYQSVQ